MAHHWYFAIGSMINPTSMALRDIQPLESHPALISNFKLEFLPSSGMAEAVPEEGASFHGVVHKLTAEDMAKLDKIELIYEKRPSTVQLYDGSVIENVHVYCISEESRGKIMADHSGAHKLPTERYIDIIVLGCLHYGVAESHVDYLRGVEKQLRKDPAAFSTFDVPDGTPTWSDDDVLRGDGLDGKPIYMSINGKVLEFIGERDGHMGSLVVRFLSGKSYELAVNKLLFDPKYGCVDRLDEISREHAASREDYLFDTMGSMCRVVAVINQTYAD